VEKNWHANDFAKKLNLVRSKGDSSGEGHSRTTVVAGTSRAQLEWTTELSFFEHPTSCRSGLEQQLRQTTCRTTLIVSLQQPYKQAHTLRSMLLLPHEKASAHRPLTRRNLST